MAANGGHMRAALVVMMLAGAAEADPLSELLMRLPPAQLSPDAPGLPLVQYGDVAAALDAADAPLQWFRGWPPNLMNLSLHDHDEWPVSVGFGPTDVAQGVTLQNPPLMMELIRFNPGVTSRIDMALRDAGYIEEDGLLNAGPQGQLAPVQSDPFQRRLGGPASISLEGDLLIHSTSTADLPGAPAALPPSLKALLPSEDVLRGVIFPVAPSIITHSDPRGVPGGALRWQGMALYDLTGGRALLVLTLPPVTEAEAVALTLALAQSGDAQLEAVTSEIWRATLMQQQPEELDPYGTWGNPAFEQLLVAAMQGQLSFLPGAR